MQKKYDNENHISYTFEEAKLNLIKYLIELQFDINEFRNKIEEYDDLKSIEFLIIKTNKGFFLLACIELENNINEINILNK